MNSIANWAKQHIAAARLLIAILHIFIFCSAVHFAQELTDAGIIFSFGQAVLVAAIGFIIIAVTGFYRKKMTARVAKRRLQRFRFLLMGISCTLLIVGFFSTQFAFNNGITTNALAAFTSTDKKEKPIYENYADHQAFYRDLKAYYSTLSKKEIRKEFRSQLRELKNSSSTTVGKVLIALAIALIAVTALTLVAVLSCGLACDGQGGLALLVLIAGIAGIILLTTLLVKAVRKNERKKRLQEQYPEAAKKESEATMQLQE